MYLNPEGSFKLNLLEWEDEAFSSLPLQEIKYGRWDKSYHLVPTPVKQLLQRMFAMMSTLGSEDREWYVDYKVRDLKVGDCGCAIPGWHTDVVSNPWHKSKPDVHLLFTTEVGTDIAIEQLEVFESDKHFNDVLKRHKNIEFVTAKPNTVSMYGRWNLHRAPIVQKDCRRMLLRLTATKVI